MQKHYLETELYKRLHEDGFIFEFLQGGALDGIWYWDLEHPENEWISPQFWIILGYDPQEKRHLPSEWQDLIYPEDLQLALDNFNKHLANPKHPYDQILRYRHRDGSTVWIRCRGMVIRNESGKPIRMLGAHTDLTPLKKAEQALKESKANFDKAQSIAHFANWETDLRTRKVRGSDELYRMLNLEADFTQEALFEKLHPDDRLYVINSIEAAIREGAPYKIDYRIIPAPGDVRYVHSEGEVARNENGLPVRFFGTIQDITERKQVENLLRESEERFRIVLENLPGGVFVHRLDGRFVFVNKAACKNMGYSKEELLHLSVADIDPDSLTRDDSTRIWDRLKAGKSATFESAHVRRDGSRYPVIVNLNAVTIDKRPAIVSITFDITERKRAEERLKELNETLEQQVTERTKLAEDRARKLQEMVSELTLSEQRERQRLAEVLHDRLQQLLVGAKINSEVLSATSDTEHKKIAENVLNLIKQSIQTSRSLTAELSPVVLKQGLSAALEWLGRWMRDKYGLSVEIKRDFDVDPQHEDITILLFQSVRELLFNVVKHAGVDSARVEMAHGGDNRLRVAVSDKGIGFDAKIISDKADAGFGISSIRERLNLLGGKFEIESSPGKGASFVLDVPVETKRATDEKRVRKLIAKIQKVKKEFEKIRVLLVDDHAVVRQGLSSMLNLYTDIEVVGEAANGEEAVEKARKLEPNVILMDISMPKMDGIEATRIIHLEFPHIRIVGLSMHDKEDQAATMIRAGASTYLQKSENTDLLLAAIRESE